MQTVLAVLGRQTEMPVKGVLRIEVDTSVLEVGIELLLCRPVLRVELVDVVVRHIERLHVPLGTDDPCFPIGDGVVQQPVAHEVHQSVGCHPRMVFREEMRVLLDKGDDVEDVLPLSRKTALSARHDDELVATDTPPVAVQTDIRGIAQAIALVQVIPRVDQHVLNVQPL